MQKTLQQISDHYFKRFPDFSKKILNKDFKNLRTIIVIPCFKEEKIIDTLKSISACNTPLHKTLILILINASENSYKEIHDFNKRTFTDINGFIKKIEINNVVFEVLLDNNLPKRHAGVGYARKILMDTALKIFTEINYDGIIVNTDADCLFTKNYIQEIETSFENSSAKHGIVHFEHRIKTEENDVLVKAITEYELHLRYYKQALQWANYPKVIHTIGSCMICRASLYALEGGMNKRKAGEDFYFMNKLAKNHKFIEVNNASVLPSCRTSDRVPFGTGKAMNNYIKEKTEIFKSYDFNCFVQLKEFIEKINLLYENNFSSLENEIDILTYQFFKNINIEETIVKIKNESKNIESFKKKFFYWFDHLKALQFIHYFTDNKYNKTNIDIASIDLLKEKSSLDFNNVSMSLLLNKFREEDKR